MSSTQAFNLFLAFVWAITANVGVAEGQTPTDRAIQSLQLHLKMYPEDYKGYDQLGAAYLQKGRETADATYYELARGALNRSLDLLSNDPAAASAKTHMALVYMAEHQFEDALSWAQDALVLGSGDPSPWAVVGDALTDMGEYDQAAAAYAKLRDPIGAGQESNGVAYERESRIAYLRFLRADTKNAISLMREAILTARTLRMPAENVAWSEYQLGEICFKSGDLSCAEEAYRAGLETDPGSYRNLAGLGEVRAAQSRYSEAIALYQKAIAVVPYPMYVASLYDLEIRLGRREEAKKQYQLIEFITKLNPINERLSYRELALFYADHNFKLGQSVTLAQQELKVRHDIYTWDVLAWVLYKSGRADQAATAMRKALALGTEDALLDFHAGAIESRLGHRDCARRFLERALRLNPHFHLFYADQAREMLAQLSVPPSAATTTAIVASHPSQRGPIQ
jgi:tetratricopeptide (TPR) repeat protein